MLVFVYFLVVLIYFKSFVTLSNLFNEGFLASVLMSLGTFFAFDRSD